MTKLERLQMHSKMMAGMLKKVVIECLNAFMKLVVQKAVVQILLQKKVMKREYTTLVKQKKMELPLNVNKKLLMI